MAYAARRAVTRMRGPEREGGCPADSVLTRAPTKELGASNCQNVEIRPHVPAAPTSNVRPEPDRFKLACRRRIKSPLGKTAMMASHNRVGFLWPVDRLVVAQLIEAIGKAFSPASPQTAGELQRDVPPMVVGPS